jgi:hypothetical protein
MSPDLDSAAQSVAASDVPDSIAAPAIARTHPEKPVVLGSRYGSCDGHAALARETSAGSWQVKIHDPVNRLSGHDGWLLAGTGWPTLAAACAATGLS